MEQTSVCWYSDALADPFRPFTEGLDASQFSTDVILQILCSEQCHTHCNDPQHSTFTEKICNALVRDLMVKVLECTTNHNNSTALLRFLIEEEGCLILQSLLKFGTKTVGTVDDLFHLMWYILKQKRSTEMEAFEGSKFNQVCSVCVQLVADLCLSESQSNRVKLPHESMAEFNAFTTNLLLEREKCDVHEVPSINSLMMYAVQSFCASASLIRSSRTVEESSVLLIVQEVGSVYHRLATKHQDHRLEAKQQDLSLDTKQQDLSLDTKQQDHSLDTKLEGIKRGDNSNITETSVVSTCLIGLLQVIESLLHKLHTLSHSMELSADVLKLLANTLLVHTQSLVESDSLETVRGIVSSLAAVVEQMKACKVKHTHNMRCTRKKHRRCDMSESVHHHRTVMSIDTATGPECGAAYITRLILGVYQLIPHTAALKMEMVERIRKTTGCCCMQLSDFITPFVEELSNQLEANQHVLMSSLTHIILNQLSGGRKDKYLNCEFCSPNSSQHADEMSGVDTIYTLISVNSTETCARIVLQNLYTMIIHCKPHVVFIFYRNIFKPLLDAFYADSEAVSKHSVRLCLKALIHSLNQDDCVDHFLSSAHGMRILELCVSEYSSLLPLILQVFSLLMQMRSEDQVLAPLLMLLLGEPEVQTTNNDFVKIELVYSTPDFNEPLSDKHMFLTREKWSCCHRLLHQSALFRAGFQSQDGIQLLMSMINDIISTLITNHTISSTQYVFLSDLFSITIGCLLLCVHHSLSFSKTVFTIECLCTEISTAFHHCDYTSNRELCVERSFHLLRLLLESSSHKLPAAHFHRHDDEMLCSGASVDEECGDTGEITSNKVYEEGDKSHLASNSSSSNSEYEADDESYQDSAKAALCSYTNYNLHQPELWMLTFELMVWDNMTLNSEQQLGLLKDLDKQIRQIDSWKSLQNKTELSVKLLEYHRDSLLSEKEDELSAVVIALVEYVCHFHVTSQILLELFTLLKLSQFKGNLLRSFHTIITQSKPMPHCSISFPIERSNKENGVAVIVSSLARFGSRPLSVVLWVYLDGGISSAYNSSHKSKQPVRLISLVRSQLKITLESEVTNGNVCLVIGNNRGDVIGRLPVSSVLTTNKWQMISFTADVKAKEGLQLYVQFSIGVDGRELVAGAETFTTPVKISLDNQSDLDFHIGQGSNLYVREHSIHFSHALIFKGRLTDIQCAELYCLGPRFDTFCRCIAEVEPSTVNRRCVMGRRLPPAALDSVLKDIKECQRQKSMQQIMAVVGPKYRPYSLAFNRQHATVIGGGKSPAPTKMRANLEDFTCAVELEQPAAYYKNPATVYHAVLEETIACLGGVHVLLYMYAQCVELKLSETSQILALQCLLYTSQFQDNFSQSAQQTLDYRLLSKVLGCQQCLLTPVISRVLIGFALRPVDGHVLLVDMTFIEQVLLDWTVWQTRPSSWELVWESLCDSVSPLNKYHVTNSQALLDSEILQTCIRVPLEQYHKDSDYPMPLSLISKLSLLMHRVLHTTQDKRLIWDISRYLLLLHPAAATFIQYERNSLYTAHHWSPLKRKFGLVGKGLLGRLRVTSIYDHDLLEDSTEHPQSKLDEADGARDDYTSDGQTLTPKGMSDYSTDTPAITSDSDTNPPNKSDLHLDIPPSAGMSPNAGVSPTIGSLQSDDMTCNISTMRTDSQHTLTPLNLGLSTPPEQMELSPSVETGRVTVTIGADSPGVPDHPIVPSSPKFARDLKGEDPPDIITSHDDLSSSSDSRHQPYSTEHSLAQLSAHLLHTLLLITPHLTPTDTQIFCSDLITLDTLTVFLNHDDVDVIYAALKLLSKVIELSSMEQTEGFIRRRGFHLVASQLNQIHSSHKLVAVCAQFINGQRCSMMKGEEMSSAFLLPLLGTLDQCCHDLNLTSKALSLTFQIIEERASSLPYAIHNGLIEVLCNCLASINTHHPEADHEQLDNVFVYIHSLLQKIANHLVRFEKKMESIKSFVCLFIILERKERHNRSDYLAISRVEMAVRVIFQELYTSIKSVAKSIPTTFIQRMFSRGGSSADVSTGIDETTIGRTSVRRDSAHPLNTSMSSLHSQQSTGESKNSKSSLTDMLLFTVQEFAMYAIYRVERCRRDEENLASLTELLLDALIVVEESGKKSTWQSIVETDRVKRAIWKQLADVLSFILSTSCDVFTAESVVSVMSQLTDISQRKIVDGMHLQAGEFLLPNVRRFLQTNKVKSICESFLTRLLDKLSSASTKSGGRQAPNSHPVREIHFAESGETITTDIWLRYFTAQRSMWKKQLTERKKIVFHCLDPLVKDMGHSATEINKDVVHRQNLERRKFIEYVKINMATEVTVSTDWQKVIRQFTHERAVWYNPSSFPQSWEMDPTEGPGRVRKRLQRCHMNAVPSKFLLEDEQYKAALAKTSPPLQYLFEEGSQSESASAALIYRLHTNETIRFTCKCSNVTPSTETLGDLLISDHCIHFVGDAAITDYDTKVLAGSHELLSIRWPLIEIKSFYRRRYQLQDNALEIFLTNGRTSLLAMDTTSERDVLWEELNKLHLPNKTKAADLESIQKQWTNGRMGNFDYLTHLNTLAGRSFNDLMQYPVFPFVLNLYEGSHIDLNDPQAYRKLNKPIACQRPENEMKYKQHYEAIEADIELCKRNPDLSHAPLAPYHYASHYSNSGVVLHYLVRLLPYTQMFLRYQDGQFDIPDRTFHSMHTSWLLSSERSSTDVKELIPEFYYLPEFMVNYEGFNFGKRHTKEQVMDLNIPDWCQESHRLFVLILRQALENVMVSRHLQDWINLVFGFQQQGAAAKEAVNKFHPATYYGLEVNSIEDELQQSAIKVMIRTYGQMPKQLFISRHPEQQADVLNSIMEQRLVSDVPVLDTVSGLCWGTYLGSPSEPAEPRVVVNELIGARSIAAISTGEIFGLRASSCVITHETKTGDELSSRTNCIWAARLNWGKSGNLLRLQIQKDKQPINFMSLPFKVTTCASLSDCRLLLIASDTGFIQVHRLHYSKQQLCDLSWVSLEVILTAHHSSVTSVVISPEYSIIVSSDASGLCVIWDVNKLTYVRCIQNETKSKIDCVAVSPTMGDIAFCSTHGTGSVMEVFTVNAKLISRVTVSSRVRGLCYSSSPEGVSVNVIVGALDNSTIQLWSSWDLKPLRTLSVPGMDEPFICCTYTHDNQLLAACTSAGRLIVWQKPTAHSRVKYFSAK